MKMMNKNNKIKALIWDWNGTILNDVVHSVNSLNYICDKYSLKSVSVELYKQNFSFPVREFYKGLGFDFAKHDFDMVSHEYINHFKAHKDIQLYPNLKELLAKIHNVGIKQYVLSAMESTLLKEMLIEHGISQYFDHIQGSDDHQANSKVDSGRRLLEKIEIPMENIVLIGDTLHDFEVANELGITSVLVSSGHNTYERLIPVGTQVCDNPEKAIEYLKLID